MMKKIILAVTVLFFSAMRLLTFLAQPIHNASLPRVTASRVEMRAFDDSYIDAEGKTVASFSQIEPMRVISEENPGENRKN